MSSVTTNLNMMIGVQGGTVQSERQSVRGNMLRRVVPRHDFVAHERACQSCSAVARGRLPQRPLSQFRGPHGKFEVPNGQSHRDGNCALVRGNRYASDVSSRGRLHFATRNGNIDPVRLILSGSDACIAGFQYCSSRAKRRAALRIVERNERLGIGSGTEGRIGAPSVIGRARDGQIVFAIKRDARCGNRCTVWTGESRGGQIDIRQAARGALYNNLTVHGLASRSRKFNRRKRFGRSRLSYTQKRGRDPDRKRCDGRLSRSGEERNQEQERCHERQSFSRAKKSARRKSFPWYKAFPIVHEQCFIAG